MPRSAKIASALGKFAPSCALAGLLGIQIGVIPPLGGFLMFQLGLLTALFALGFGLTALIVTRKDQGGTGREFVPEWRLARHVRSAWLHRVGSDVAGIHSRDQQRCDPLHPDGILLVDRRSSR